MCLEPQLLDAFLINHLFDVVYGLLVKFHCRAGVDDVKPHVLARHAVKYRLVGGEWGGACIAVVVAECALAPTATRSLQQQELAL